MFFCLFPALLNGRSRAKQEFSNVDQFVLEQLVYEQLNGFLLIVSSTGKIIFVSQTMEQLLGHLQVREVPISLLYLVRYVKRCLHINRVLNQIGTSLISECNKWFYINLFPLNSIRICDLSFLAYTAQLHLISVIIELSSIL